MRKRKTRSPRASDDGEGLSLPDTSYGGEPEITPGLVPTGIPGIYQSPVEPVDPYDCQRWPDSPYCGGSLLQDELISLTPQISINPCETCITFTPVLARISLPPYTICKRNNNPSCIPQVPKPKPQPKPGVPNSYQKRCKDGSYQYIGHIEEVTIDGVTYPVGTDYNTIAKATFDWQMKQYVEQYGTPTEWRTAVTFHPDDPYLADGRSMSDSYQRIKVLNDNKTYSLVGDDEVLFEGANWIGKFTYLQDLLPPDAMKGKEGSFTTSMSLASIVYFNAPGCDEVPDTQGAPAPAYPPSRGCCMSCCNSREAEENNELLRLIARRLGTSDYPFTVPANLLASRSRSAKKLESNAQVWEWFIRQFDALAGQFPIEIEIQDADPTKQGDQAAKIKVDNISEALAELLGIGINTSINTESLVNIGIRTLTEAGMAKNAAIVAQDLGLANAEFLDYELKQITRKIPSTFTPGKVELDDILQESTQQIRSYENVDDHQLKDYMTELLQGVAIIRAAFWRKLDPNKPYSSQIRSLLRNLVSLADNELTKDENGRPKEKTPTEDFDSFLEQVERGFADQPGIQDATKPYGRNPESRPRIRELGDQSEG